MECYAFPVTLFKLYLRFNFKTLMQFTSRLVAVVLSVKPSNRGLHDHGQLMPSGRVSSLPHQTQWWLVGRAWGLFWFCFFNIYNSSKFEMNWDDVDSFESHSETHVYFWFWTRQELCVLPRASRLRKAQGSSLNHVHHVHALLISTSQEPRKVHFISLSLILSQML